MKTSNYAQFKFKTTNRPISRRKVLSLKDNFLKFGYDENYPVLIDKDFRVQDGQHRFVACMELNLPVFYNYSKHESDEYMRSLNIVSSGWELTDYINSYANEERLCYINLIKFKENHKLTTTVALIIFCGNSSTKDIREGKELKVNINAEKIINLLNLFKDLEFYRRKNFAIAVVSLFSKNPTDEQLDKLIKNRLQINEWANTSQYLNCFENIINKFVKKDKIYFR